MRPVLAVLFALVMTTTTVHAQSLPAFTAPLERGHPLVGRLWLPGEGRFATAEEVVERARVADAVLLGETHDNPDHHALQAWMVGRLVEHGRRPLVAFEMIDPSQEPALKRHLADHPGDAAGLGAALDWEKSAWPSWALYGPIAAAALRGDAGLAPANLTHDQVRAIARSGTDDALPPLSSAQVARIAEDIKAGHCGMLPDAAVSGMVRVQRSRDAVMARALAAGLADRGHAVLIAGTGHVRADHGVPAALAQVAPQATVFALGFLEVRPDRDTPAAYGASFGDGRLPFDAVWFTPAAEREDMCAAFKRHMEKNTTLRK